jgi:hypothetical protein
MILVAVVLAAAKLIMRAWIAFHPFRLAVGGRWAKAGVQMYGAANVQRSCRFLKQPF